MKREFARYLFVSVGALAVDYATLFALVAASLPLLAAKTVAVAASFFVVYLMRSVLVFRSGIRIGLPQAHE
ncbi:MAG: GtrA family protein [Burkholderiaceae bacterium]|nr:GtrA family protein [Burkholderiaceae bacterium]